CARNPSLTTVVDFDYW
nr:immunoglobulin heavy chain junction region [Mus musculus]